MPVAVLQNLNLNISIVGQTLWLTANLKSALFIYTWTVHSCLVCAVFPMNIYSRAAPGQVTMELQSGMPSKSESFQLLSEAISVFSQINTTDESSDSSNEVRLLKISRLSLSKYLTDILSELLHCLSFTSFHSQSKWNGSGSSTPALCWPQHQFQGVQQPRTSWHQEAPYRNNGFSQYQGHFSAQSRGGQEPSAALQPRLLKQINSLHTKEELLQLISTSVQLFDDINLVTAVHRLAKLSGFIKSPSARFNWTNELQSDPNFHCLLSTIQSKMINNHMRLMGGDVVKGLDSRCVSNLIWALVKLEVDLEVGSLGYELIRCVSPLVIRFLSSSSSQGLANLLWAYSKMPAPLLEAMMLIVAEMSERLHDIKASQQFDAQALSNSIWALAHVRSKFNDLDAVVGGPPGGLTTRFMLGIAFSAMNLLRNGAASAVAFASRTFQMGSMVRGDVSHLQSIMMESEKRFSCQALVNIAWSFASMLGEDVTKIPAICDLFLCIRSECLIRLNTTLSALSTHQPWILRMQGGFNEQALSNVVYAFDKAQVLDRELLQLVFDVGTLRLDSGGDYSNGGLPLGGHFKPQELCTLLRAAHMGRAQPWVFLSKLHSVVAAMPQILQGWSPGEHAELDRAFSLLDTYRMTLQQLQQQSAQQALSQMMIGSHQPADPQSFHPGNVQ